MTTVNALSEVAAGVVDHGKAGKLTAATGQHNARGQAVGDRL